MRLRDNDGKVIINNKEYNNVEVCMYIVYVKLNRGILRLREAFCFDL